MACRTPSRLVVATPWFLPCGEPLEKSLAVPVCLHSSVMVCPATLDLIGVVTSGCFAASIYFIDVCLAVVVAGPSLANALQVRVPWPPPQRMLPYVCLGSLAPSLVDALLPKVCWPGSLADALPPWSLGSLADALPRLMRVARSLGGCFATADFGLLAQETIAFFYNRHSDESGC
jgi:hypothetical protein